MGRRQRGGATSLLALLHHVPHAADRVDQLDLERFIQLRTQPAYRHLDNVRIAVEVDVPHLFRHHGARQDFPTPTQQQRKQIELLGCEFESLAGPCRLSACQIDLQIRQSEAGGKLSFAISPTATQQGLDPSGQFGERERLDEVVVCAAGQSLDLVFDRVAGRQHQDGRPALPAQFREHLEAVPSRQHHIEDDQVVRALDSEMKSVDAVMCQVDDIAAL
mmetsp:Transcript_61822/g.146363  ORF Transcript_61822/g.146363 Transcript_61822/m.146363 type:complete len:219 (-) Transcript_61822:3668-4324(-)